jgi:hypothetical protein
VNEVDNNAAERERLFLKHPGLSDPYFSKWFDPGDSSFRISLLPRNITDLRAGNPLD